MHLIFHVNKLWKHPDNLLYRQLDPKPKSLNIYSNNEYKVKAILGVRLVYRLLWYKVKWQGLDDDPAEYSPKDLRHAPFALQTFHKQYPRRPGPPKNL
jgi:hypothetical protein